MRPRPRRLQRRRLPCGGPRPLGHRSRIDRAFGQRVSQRHARSDGRSASPCEFWRGARTPAVSADVRAGPIGAPPPRRRQAFQALRRRRSTFPPLRLPLSRPSPALRRKKPRIRASGFARLVERGGSSRSAAEPWPADLAYAGRLSRRVVACNRIFSRGDFTWRRAGRLSGRRGRIPLFPQRGRNGGAADPAHDGSRLRRLSRGIAGGEHSRGLVYS
jgi:hypothetical protein